MSRSVRFPLGIFNGLRKQERRVNSVSQRCGRSHVAFQVGNNAGNNFNAAVSHGNVAGHGQRNTNYSVHMRQTGRIVEIDNGQGYGGEANGLAVKHGGAEFGLNVCGVIGHDGSPKYFKWDNAKGCMVPYVVSTPFRSRLARSVDAFLRSWRLG